MSRNSIAPFRKMALLLLTLGFAAHSVPAYEVLDNGKLRVGTGAENSVNSQGNLQQPFYYDANLGGWYKLTYNIYPLDNAVGVGGDGTNEWNTNGAIVENGALTGQTIDITGYTATSASTGHGTIVSTGTMTVDNRTLEMRNTYVLGIDKSFIKITTRLTNTSGSTVENVRVWVGTRDDWVGTSDTPTKQRGNLTATGFEAIASAATRAAALQITSGQTGVLFHSTSPKAHTSINFCCSFENAYQTAPTASAIQATDDGSYALFVRMQDLAHGASEEFTWYYAAGAVDELGDIAEEVGEEASAVNVTSSAGAGGSIAPASAPVAPGASTQFTVTPNAGYRIASVQGCSGSLNANVFTTGSISTACNVSATFVLDAHLVTATAATGGTITAANATVAHGETTTLTVVPEQGYDIGQVTGCGGSLSDSTYTTGPITAACTVTAGFIRKSHTVSAAAGRNGAISPTSAQVSHGDSTSFSMTPASGYTIAAVGGCGGSLNGNTYTTAGISDACSVQADFEPMPPSFQEAPSHLYDMNATELLTELPGAARPHAFDYAGAALSVVPANGETRYAPGQHRLTWRAIDSRGVLGTIEQTLRVWPTINFGPDLSIGARAGNYDVFRIALNGRSPVYPFTVSYAVSGDSQGTTLESGSVTFEDGEVERQIPFAILATLPVGSAERTVHVSLNDQLNRGSARPLTINLTTINQAPTVNLHVTQSGEEQPVVSRDSGLVTLSADIRDPDTADTHTIEWRAPVGAAFTVSGGSIVIDPSSLPAGVHRFELIVTDSGAPPIITRRSFDVVVTEARPVLPAGAARLLANGLPDSPAYAPVAPNVLPERAGELAHHLMEADAGTRLALGSYAKYLGAYQTEIQGDVSAVRIPSDSVANVGGYFDFIVDDVPRVGEAVGIVIPQRAAVPTRPVYRKYDPAMNKWQTFLEDNDNRLASAPGSNGFCPPPTSSEYRNGLHPGDWCVRLTIKDGGVNDTDGAANGSVSDPGGVGSLSEVVVTGKTSGGGGSFDATTLIGALFLLMLRAIRQCKLGAAIALLSLAATQASAASADDASSWYAGAQFGLARSGVSDTDMDTALQQQGYEVTSRISDTGRGAWRVHVGHELSDVFALEAAYLDLGEVTASFTGPIADLRQFLIDANAVQPPSAEGFDLAGVARYSLGSRFSVHARAGAFFWDARFVTRNAGGEVARRSERGIDAMAGIGAQVRVFRQWHVGLEVTRHGVDGDHVDFAGVGVTFRSP